MSRPVLLSLLYYGVLSKQALLVWYLSVTPQLSPAGDRICGRQLTVYLQEKQASGVLCGRILNLFLPPQCQQQTTAPAWPQTQSVIFLLCLPKGQINKKTLLLHADSASPFATNGKIAGVLKKRQQHQHMSRWKLERCLPFRLHSTFLGHRSILIPNAEKLFSPALVSWQPQGPDCSGQSL